VRLNRLDLVAYGHFTDLKLDFSDEHKSFVVIYGPNEAGKTTIKSAIEELLFDFHNLTPYGFKHGYNELKISAVLSNLAGDTLAFSRIKKRSNNILAPDGSPLPTDVLVPYVRNLTKDGFCSQFSLTRDEMLKGSQDIVEGKGELGSSLYSAALGNRSLSDIIKSLDEQAKAIFSRQQPLNKALDSFDIARSEWRKAQITPATWQELVTDRDAATGRLRSLNEQYGDLSAAIGRLERLRAQAPAFEKLLAIRAALAEHETEPVIETEVIAQVNDLLQKQSLALEKIAAANDRVEELTREGEDEQAEQLLEHDATIRNLTAKIGVYSKGRQDLVDVRHRERAATMQAEAQLIRTKIWPGVSAEDVVERVVSTDTIARGNELALAHAGIIAQVSSATTAVGDLKARIESAEAGLADLPTPTDTSSLRAAITTAQGEGRIDAAISDKAAAIEKEGKSLERDVRALGLFTGDPKALMEVALPQLETVSRFKSDFDGLRDEDKSIQQRRNDLIKRRDAAIKALRDFEKTGDLRTSADLLDLRVVRDKIYDELEGAWRASRPIEDLDVISERYRPSVTASDGLSDELQANSDRAARVAQLIEERDGCTTDLETLDASATSLTARVEALTATWGTEWAHLSIVPKTPDEMAAWVRSALELRKRFSALEELREASEALQARRSELIGLLQAAVSGVGQKWESSPLLAPLVVLASEVVERNSRTEAERARLVVELRGCTRDLEKQNAALSTAQGSIESWKAAWAGVLKAAWLPPSLAPLDFAEAVADVEQYHTIIYDAGVLLHRANNIDADNVAITNEVVSFMALHAPDLELVARTAPDAAMESLAERLSRAKTAHDKREQRDELLETQNRLLAAAMAAEAGATGGLTAIAFDLSVPIEELGRSVARAEETNGLRSAFEKSLVEVTSEIGLSLAECETEYSGRNREAIDSALSITKAQLQDLQPERDQLIELRRDLETKLNEIDNSRVAADAEARMAALGATIDQKARRWAELTLARTILDEQVREYTEKHQGPLVERSGEYFRKLTGGAYEKLRVINENNKQLLHAVTPDGKSTAVNDLSDGTRDQLYLALRLAALEEYFKTNEPQPVILDDGLIQFDDERTGYAMEALAELSKTTQVLYFTHHRACVALASSVVPADRLAICELPSRWAGVASSVDSVLARV
jgi:uncharacterized protein YhaN